METQWLIMVLAGIIVILFASHSARGARIKELEARLAHVQQGVEALRRELYAGVWQSPEQTQFQQNVPSFAGNAHLPETRMTLPAQQASRGLLEELAGIMFLLLVGGAVILMVSGGH
jgi:hypothetical protein